MTRNLPLLGLVIVAIIVCLPIVGNNYLPLVDLPNHMARQYIAVTPGTPLDDYYAYEFKAKGNSAADLIWYVAAHKWLTVETFSNWVFAVYGAGLVFSVSVLWRVVHGRWGYWPLASALLVYNAPFFWGFQNFLLTIPFAILALALWLALEPVKAGWRALLFMPVCYVLYQMHTLGFAVLLFSAFGREVHRLILARRDVYAKLVSTLVSATSFLIPVSIAVAQAVNGPTNLYGSLTEFGGLPERIRALRSPFFATPAIDYPMAAGLSIATMAFFIFVLLSLRRRTGPRLQFASKLIGPVISLAILSAVLPFRLDGVALVNIRFPFVVLALVIGGTAWRGMQRHNVIVLVAAALVLGGLRIGQVDWVFSRHSDEIADLRTVLSEVPKGARLLTVRMSPPDREHRMWHVQAHAVPVAQAFVPTLFQGAHGLTVKPAWRDRSIAQGASLSAQLLFNVDPGSNSYAHDTQSAYWQGWKEKFNVLLTLDPLPAEIVTKNGLSLVSMEGRFALYTF